MLRRCRQGVLMGLDEAVLCNKQCSRPPTWITSRMGVGCQSSTSASSRNPNGDRATMVFRWFCSASILPQISVEVYGGWGRTRVSGSAADSSRFKVPITQVGTLNNHVTDSSRAWLRNGGAVGDRPSDHNLGGIAIFPTPSYSLLWRACCQAP